MFKKHLFLFILLLCCFVKSNSQTPSYYHYTSSDGLASSTIYDIIQGKDGYIWFATTNGISKFDGKRFHSYNINDGLNSNSIISLLENKNGDIYIGNFEKGINLLRDGKIENYYSEIDGERLVISYLIFDNSEKDKQKIIAYSNWRNLNIISDNKSTVQATLDINSNGLRINKLEELPNGDVVALTTTGLFNYKTGLFSKINIKGLPNTNIHCLYPGNDNSYIIGTKGALYKIKNNTVIQKYPINITSNNEVNAILSDKNNNIWFSIKSKGFYFIQNGLDKITDMGIKLGLQNTLVNKFFEDVEGNIWVSTMGKGVYCINNLYLKNYNENDGLSNNNVYSIINSNSGYLLVGTFNGINILENNRFSQINYPVNKRFSIFIYNIKNIGNTFYISSAFETNDIINASYKGIKLHLLNTLSFCKLSNGLYLSGLRNNNIEIKKELNTAKNKSSVFSVFGDRQKPNRINEIFEDTEKNIWIGTGLGLCKASVKIDKSGKLEIKKTFFQSNAVLNSRINTISQDSENNIWIAGEKGIAKYNLKNDSITSYTSIGAYDLSASTSLAIDNKKRIWIGNMKGLYLFDGTTIKYFNTQTGLPSNEVYALFYDSKKNQLNIGSTGGLSILDINLLSKQITPQLNVNITSIKAGDSVYTKYQHLIFKPKQHDVTVNFKSFNFSSPRSVKYLYKLNDNQWKQTDNDFLNFISLKYGKYTLLFKSKSQNGNWGEPTQLNFEIEPHFTETLWFQFLILLVVAVVSVLVVTWLSFKKQQKIREELNLNERINTLKHQALSAMMNPHFIFNALNSVQYLINCKRNEEANDYIAMMAKLIRKNLETAKSGFILLDEEISRLKLYLDIEKLRLQKGFLYDIIISDDVNSHGIKIPNMIIQPFVENTLWHGIINSRSKGLVSISFSFENVDIDNNISKSLIIKITDNGIGIIEAKKRQKANHISKGIAIIEERLSLLSEKMTLPQPIMFEDLSHRDDQSHGTEVIISLPPPLYQVIVP